MGAKYSWCKYLFNNILCTTVALDQLSETVSVLDSVFVTLKDSDVLRTEQRNTGSKV